MRCHEILRRNLSKIFFEKCLVKIKENLKKLTYLYKNAGAQILNAAKVLPKAILAKAILAKAIRDDNYETSFDHFITIF